MSHVISLEVNQKIFSKQNWHIMSTQLRGIRPSIAAEIDSFKIECNFLQINSSEN